MSDSIVRQGVALLALAALAGSPAAGFDTYWHSECSHRVGEKFGFTDQAWKIMQLGNFSPDFFGPVSEYAMKSPALPLAGLNEYQAGNPQVRGAALFLHFDNLYGGLQRNADFDYLLTQLLNQTRTLLSGYSHLKIDDRVRKTLTLVTLGAALHAVQDFYSHSDWVHNDFDKTEVRVVRLPGGGVRTPTWFEFRNRYGDPARWPVHVRTGIYPPTAGDPYTHTHMNHDNSRLVYAEPENPGPLMRSQAQYHDCGAAPARGDAESDLAHQHLAFETAAAASIEFVNKVEEDADARKSIEFAKVWNLKGKDSRLGKELHAGFYTAMAISCAAGKWDGEDPPGDRGVFCRSVLGQRLSSANGGGSQFESEILGLATSILMPAALKFTGMFWDVHGQYHILEHLAEDFATDTGHYRFGKK
ncbi:MAG: hypothetical protein U0Q18_07785 [Bryobacteraceae bacterium]